MDQTVMRFKLKAAPDVKNIAKGAHMRLAAALITDTLSASRTSSTSPTATAIGRLAARFEPTRLRVSKALHRRGARVASVALLMAVSSFGLSMLILVSEKF